MSLPSTTGSPSMGGAAAADNGSVQPCNYCDGVPGLRMSYLKITVTFSACVNQC